MKSDFTAVVVSAALGRIRMPIMKTLASTTLALAITLCAEARAQIAPITATPNWNRAMPNGPDATVKITDEYAKQVGRDAYFGRDQW
jgi:hypothetical protein